MEHGEVDRSPLSPSPHSTTCENGELAPLPTFRTLPVAVAVLHAHWPGDPSGRSPASRLIAPFQRDTPRHQRARANDSETRRVASRVPALVHTCPRPTADRFAHRDCPWTTRSRLSCPTLCAGPCASGCCPLLCSRPRSSSFLASPPPLSAAPASRRIHPATPRTGAPAGHHSGEKRTRNASATTWRVKRRHVL